MFRRIACAGLLCTALAAAGCGDTQNPIAPESPQITETFTGTLTPAAGVTHAFTTLTGGAIKATLTTVGPDAAKNVGFSLGTFNPILNTCTANFDNPAALQAFEFSVTASTIGAYCVRIYDNGNVTTDGVNYTYTITVQHPQ